MLIITDKKVIGRKEKVDFPELGLKDIDAKVDTGAFTSSMHCHNVEPIRRGNKKMVKFNLLDPEHPAYNEKEFILPVKNFKQIRSSTGEMQKRYVIETQINLFGETFDIELSLADRSKMENPVLLGRKLLRKRFVVDIDSVNQSRKFERTQQKKRKKKG